MVITSVVSPVDGLAMVISTWFKSNMKSAEPPSRRVMRSSWPISARMNSPPSSTTMPKCRIQMPDRFQPSLNRTMWAAVRLITIAQPMR